jgi:hypothetical protein
MRARSRLQAETDLTAAQKRDRRLTLTILILSFAAVFIYNLLTPMITDDFYFAAESRRAGSFAAILQQNCEEYLTWTGRFVPHLLGRVFLALPAILFKVLNSVMFGLLTWLVYLNIRRRATWDPFVMLLVSLGMWLFSVNFAETVLWETGAFNYLWAVVFILGFMTMMRRTRRRTYSVPAAAVMAVLSCAFGLLAGSCSENTSGGCLLYMLLLLFSGLRRKEKLRPHFLAGLAGNVAGLLILVRAPGNAVRYDAKQSVELHTGLYGMFARMQKVTLAVRDCHFVLLAVLTAAIVLTALQLRHEPLRRRITANKDILVFGFLAAATSYALILTPEPQNRALYGAGIFLLIAAVQGVRNITLREAAEDRSILMRSVCYCATAVLLLYFFFLYVDCGANLARVNRDEEERETYIAEQKDAGNDDIVVAQLHPDFNNRYTIIYSADLTDDPAYWVNGMYENYFGVTSIRAIPYDEWETRYGSGSSQ